MGIGNLPISFKSFLDIPRLSSEISRKLNRQQIPWRLLLELREDLFRSTDFPIRKCFDSLGKPVLYGSLHQFSSVN